MGPSGISKELSGVTEDIKLKHKKGATTRGVDFFKQFEMWAWTTLKIQSEKISNFVFRSSSLHNCKSEWDEPASNQHQKTRRRKQKKSEKKKAQKSAEEED